MFLSGSNRYDFHHRVTVLLLGYFTWCIALLLIAMTGFWVQNIRLSSEPPNSISSLSKCSIVVLSPSHRELILLWWLWYKWHIRRYNMTCVGGLWESEYQSSGVAGQEDTIGKVHIPTSTWCVPSSYWVLRKVVLEVPVCRGDECKQNSWTVLTVALWL